MSNEKSVFAKCKKLLGIAYLFLRPNLINHRGLFEVSLTFCLGKTRAASGVEFYLWGSGFLASTVLSMALLAKAVQTLPLGTAYAIWTGIGAVGTVLIGIFVFKEPATPIRLFFLFTLIASLIGLKIVSY